MLCASCFEDKGEALVCRCKYPEEAARPALFLPCRHRLAHGRYTVGRVLGSPGGFGLAYKAWDHDGGTIVVIKECLPAEAQDVVRERNRVSLVIDPDRETEHRHRLRNFRYEIRLLRGLSSSCRYIVRVIDDFSENNTHYYVMPYVQGEDLRQHRQERADKRIPPSELLEVTRKLLAALSELHRRRIYHCDIKPSNILVTQRKRNPVLIDFGAARSPANDEPMTLWTGKYAAPEQILMKDDWYGPWTDLFALSATLYECLAGVPPASAKERLEGAAYVPIGSLVPGLDPGLATLIDSGLVLPHDERLPDTAAALQLLGTATGPTDQDASATGAPPPIGPSVPGRPRRKLTAHWLLAPAAAALGYGAVGGELGFVDTMAGWPGLLTLASGAAWAWFIGPGAGKGTDAPATSRPPSAPSDPVAAGSAPAIELRFRSRALELVRVVHANETLEIGRSAGAQVSIANRRLSGRHARITVLPDGQFVLEDLRSTNHLFVHKRHSDGSEEWEEIPSATGRKGRFMLGPPQADGVLLEIRPHRTR